MSSAVAYSGIGGNEMPNSAGNSQPQATTNAADSPKWQTARNRSQQKDGRARGRGGNGGQSSHGQPGRGGSSGGGNALDNNKSQPNEPNGQHGQPNGNATEWLGSPGIANDTSNKTNAKGGRPLQYKRIKNGKITNSIISTRGQSHPNAHH